MDLKHRFSGILEFAERQARYFYVIIMQKIRIIGFANKRIDLFTRLGRQVYMTDRETGRNSPEIETLFADIKETEREIKNSENIIIAAREESMTDRSRFFNTMTDGPDED